MSENPISFKRNVLIPAGQSLILGLFLGGFAFILAKTKSPIPDRWGIAVGLLAASILYFAFTVLSYETKPKSTTRIFDDEVHVKLIDDTTPYKRGTFILLSIPRIKLILLSKDLTAGKSFSLASFGGKGKLFSRTQFETLRDEFVLRGLAVWKNQTAHAQGLELTRGGRAFVRYYSTQFIIPPPPKERLPNEFFVPLTHKHTQTRRRKNDRD